MSTNNYYLINVQDLPNAQRAKYRTEHLTNWVSSVQNGVTVAGGALLSQEARTTDPNVATKSVGSFLVVKADSIEHALEILKTDAFWSSGEVWDHEKVTITPVFVAAPKVE